MVLRPILTFVLFAIFVFAAPARAYDFSGNVSPVKILPYSALMKLPKKAQLEYVRGVRDILAEMERSQKTARRSPAQKKKMNAQIEFLKMFIQDAEASESSQRALVEAWYRGNPCASSLVASHPGLQAHIGAGARLTCVPGVSTLPCPSGTHQIGNTGPSNLTKVCMDYRHEDRAKWLAAKAKLSNTPVTAAKPQAIKPNLNVSRSAANAADKIKITPSGSTAKPTLSSKAPATQGRRAVAGNADAGNHPSTSHTTGPIDDNGESQQQSSGQPETTAPAEGASTSVAPIGTAGGQLANGADSSFRTGISQADAEGYERYEQASDIKQGKDFDHKTSEGFDHVSFNARDGAGIPLGKTIDADEFSNGFHAGDIVIRSRDEDGDFHEVRRKISNLHVNTSGKGPKTKDDDDSEHIEQDCTRPPPEVDVACKKPSANEDESASNRVPRSKKPHCLIGGMLSHFDGGPSSDTCLPTHEFCINSVTCRNKNNELYEGAQVNLSCAANQAICNPYLFDINTDGKPFCVAQNEHTIESCQKTADSTKDRQTFYLNTSATSGVVEGWNEFAAAFNNICFDDGPDKDKYCTQCAIMKNRLFKLHMRVLNMKANGDEVHSTGNLNLCDRMLKLNPVGSSGTSRPKQAAPANANQ